MFRQPIVLPLRREITIPKVLDRSQQAFVSRNYRFPTEHLRWPMKCLGWRWLVASSQR